MNFSQIVDKYTKQEIKKLNLIEVKADDIKGFSSVIIDAKTNPKQEQFNIKKVLYYIEVINISEVSAEEICKTISENKGTNKLPKLPKVNFDNAKIKGNNILYVGKSFGNFRYRLKQHIGNESQKTYALHLKEWEKFFKKEVKLKLHFISLEKYLSDNEDNLLEMFESAMHLELKPLLGRTGH